MSEPIVPQPPDPNQVISYASANERRRNPLAVASLICGLAFCFPIIPGALATTFGAMALKRAKENEDVGRGMALAGLILGILNLVFSLAFVGVAMSAVPRARDNAMKVACAAQLRQLGQACMIYASQNKGYMPPNITVAYTLIPGARGCPAATTTTPATGPNYIYVVPPNTKMQQMKNATKYVVAYEPLANHKNSGMNVLYADGHVAFIAAPTASATIAALKAGTNPPP